MATDSHLALARPIVPAFLRKLYQMVNDDRNRDLITWSDAGDSFFVLDHEQFARQVLGHWFKHQRFSSFVRQLNMYGFHKVPHLQQGVLRSDSDTEYWNFAHPNFRRNQPDLLRFIQRKKQSTAVAQDGVINIRDPNTPTTTSNVSPTTNPPASPSPTLSLTQGQLLDMHSILQGIAAIKRHQTTISSELTDLKQTNQILYSESLVARSKLQKQQELIDRILKFLAGVFGSSHSGSTGSGGGHHNRRNASSDELDALMRGSDANRAVVPRRRQSAGGRLMIEGAKVGEGSGKPGIVELEELREGSMGDDERDIVEEDVTMIENNFNSNYAVETPISVPSPSSFEKNTAAAAATIGETKDRPDSANVTTNPTPTAPNAPLNIPTQPSTTASSDSNTTSPQTNTHLELERALTPTNNHLNHNNTFEINQPWANILGGRNGITSDQLSHLLTFLAQTGPNGNVSSTGGLDESLTGFDHQTPGYNGHDDGDLGLGSIGGGGYGGQGVVQPGQIQGGGGGQPSSSSTGGNHLTYPQPYSPSGFDFASFLQNLSPPSSAGLPPLPSSSSPSLQQQQQQQQHLGLSPYGLLQDSLYHSSNDEGGGLITLDSSSSPNNNAPFMSADGSLSPNSRMERQFQSTQEVEKEVNDMDKQMDHWIEQLGPILGNAIGANESGDGNLVPSSTASTTSSSLTATGMENLGSGSTTDSTAVAVPTGAVIPPNTNGLEDLDFDSFLHNMNISNPASHGGVGDGDDDDDDDDDDFLDDDEEEEEESEGVMSRVNGAGGLPPTLKKVDQVTSVSKLSTLTRPESTTTTNGGGKKRKSDVMMSEPLAFSSSGVMTQGGTKTKRRKD